MSRTLTCDFCSMDFADYDNSVQSLAHQNWCYPLTRIKADVCAECATTIVANMAGAGGCDLETLRLFYKGDFTKVGFVAPCKDDGEDLDFDPEDTPLDFGPDDVAVAMGEAAKVVAARAVEAKLFGPEHNPDATPNDVFHLTMHGAGLNPEHELLFQTVDEAKDYAAKNAQVFPEAAYRLTCPDGVVLQGDSNVAWTNPHAPLDPSEVRVNWKVAGKVASQPKKA